MAHLNAVLSVGRILAEQGHKRSTTEGCSDDVAAAIEGVL